MSSSSDSTDIFAFSVGVAGPTRATARVTAPITVRVRRRGATAHASVHAFIPFQCVDAYLATFSGETFHLGSCHLCEGEVVILSYPLKTSLDWASEAE